jgi:hypothetical protein
LSVDRNRSKAATIVRVLFAKQKAEYSGIISELFQKVKQSNKRHKCGEKQQTENNSATNCDSFMFADATISV